MLPTSRIGEHERIERDDRHRVVRSMLDMNILLPYKSSGDAFL